MIKIHNLEKYFNKNKSNEIHVINNISLTLPEKGLVVLLGPSGSGKTTLLNVLGGLDKTQAGEIDFDGEIIKGYRSGTWDHIRNEHIGYIFQNYNLLYDQSVYDNIGLSLRMVGITDKKEIDTRVEYLLSNMGMINYKRRKASALSGGQQQRVAIARALAKNPKVIIADEPTGNLDSKNTYDIMNILRAISQNKLVVLVTHEENIANLYADRIIRLRDGVVVEDIENKSIGGIDVQLETDIYLKDLHQVADYKSDKASYQVFADEETDSTFDVKLIVRNKTLYVQVDSDQYTRINLLEDDSEVAVFDEHFKGQEIEEFSETEFDLAKVIDDSHRKAGSSVIPFKEAVRLGFNQFKGMKFLKLFRNALFVVNAMIIGIALALLFNAYSVENLDFYTDPVNQINVVRGDETFEEMIAYEDNALVEYIRLDNSLSLSVQLPKVYQTRGREVSYTANVIPSRYFDESTLVMGRAVENQNEVVLHEATVKSLMNNSTFEALGIQTMDDFMKLKLSYTVMDGYGITKDIEVKIVGITDIDDPVIYAKEETLWQMFSHFGVYEAYQDDITGVRGTLSEEYRTLLWVDSQITLDPLTDTILSVLGQDFNVEATFTTTNEDVPNVLVPLQHLKEAQFATEYMQNGGVVNVYTTDPVQALTVFSESSSVDYPYTEMRMEYTQIQLLRMIPYILFAGVFLGVAFIGTFLIMRSSLLSRIYEISVYRALGAPKKDLRRVFLVEVLILTMFTSLIGYGFISYILYQIQQATAGIFPLFKITPLSFLVGLALVVLVNVVSGVLPVTNLLRKTPAEIISKYDF